MGHWIDRGLVTLSLASLCLISVPGCGSGVATITPENHLSELEFEKARALASLRETIVLERTSSASLRTQEDEKRQVLQDLAQKETALRYATDQVQKLTTERNELEKGLADARESDKKIKESHEKLKDLAFNSTHELTELKTRAESATQAKEKLATENRTIARQLETSTRELDDLKGELTRTRAVVRSLQEHEPLPPGVQADGVLRDRITELERQLAEANSAREHGGDRTAETAPAVVVRPPEKLAQKDLWKGLWALTVERVEAAWKGEFQWDAFEIALTGILGIVLLGPLVMLFLIWRGRRYRRLLAELRASVTSGGDDDLDQAVDAVGLGAEPVRQGSSRNLEEAPARAANRRSTYVPPQDRDFSAIISSPRKGKDRSEAVAAEPASPAVKSVAPQAKKPVEPQVKKPVEAPRAPEREKSTTAAAVEAALPVIEREPRRVINKAFEEPGPKPRPALEPRAHVRPKPAPIDARSRAGGDEEADADMASTQIISPLRASEPLFAPERPSAKATEPAKSRGEPSPAPGGEDRELLDELKDIINKKFDELMKK
jgi:hypothetical protein